MSDKEYIERGALLSRFKYPDRSVIIAQLQQDAFTDGLDSTAILKITDAVVAIRNSMVEAIKTTPTADVEPVVHAHWIHERYDGNLAIFSRCSKCGFQYNASVLDAKTFKSKIEKEYNYCPNCGAHMDEHATE